MLLGLGVGSGCGGAAERADPGSSGAGGGAEDATAGASGAKATGGAANGGNPGGKGNTAGMGAAGTPQAGAATGGTGAGGAGNAGNAGRGGIGEGGSDGTAPCNDLQLVALTPQCSVFSELPTPQGGAIVVGTYAMSAYEQASCLNGLEQTLRLALTAPDTYSAETVINLGGDARANTTMRRIGTELRATSTCNGEDDDDAFGYSAYEEQGESYLVLIREDYGVFTYRKVAD